MTVLWLLGCAARPQMWESEGEVRLSDLRVEGVTVAPVVLVKDLPAPPIPPPAEPGRIEQELAEDDLGTPTSLDVTRDAAFLRNDYTGNVRFGGGLIRTGEVALEVRARVIEFGQQDTYAAQGERWFAGAVDSALTDIGIPLSSRVVEPPALARVPVRGLHEEDGHDNLNLPRVALEPGPAPAVDGVRWLLVPYLRAYYTHNAGWFLGQTMGCMSGARVDAFLVLYDVAAARPVWWMEATGRHIQDMKGQASRAELDQYLLWAEDGVEQALEKGLFR